VASGKLEVVADFYDGEDEYDCRFDAEDQSSIVVVCGGNYDA
jgi:hypothetical protein